MGINGLHWANHTWLASLSHDQRCTHADHLAKAGCAACGQKAEISLCTKRNGPAGDPIPPQTELTSSDVKPKHTSVKKKKNQECLNDLTLSGPARTPAASPSVTFTGFPVSTGHKAHVTFTAVPSRGVQALAIATQVEVLRALIKIYSQKDTQVTLPQLGAFQFLRPFIFYHCQPPECSGVSS